MAPNLGDNEDEVHIRNYRCHSSDRATTLRFGTACQSFCWAVQHVSGVLLCRAFTLISDNEVGYDEHLNIIDAGQLN